VTSATSRTKKHNTACLIGHEHRRRRSSSGITTRIRPHTTTADTRRSYVTHLIEDGFDPYFVQRQVGHAWGSTTALYTGVSGDFKNRMLRQALDRAFTADTTAGAEPIR
jgi:integrase/recombinase XerC